MTKIELAAGLCSSHLTGGQTLPSPFEHVLLLERQVTWCLEPFEGIDALSVKAPGSPGLTLAGATRSPAYFKSDEIPNPFRKTL